MVLNNGTYFNINRDSSAQYELNEIANGISAKLDNQRSVKVSPMLDDYLLINSMINGYTEMGNLNQEISREFAPCEADAENKLIRMRFR
ncbi:MULTISPECIES: hypothetical protein [Apilactobacillus]|uniref:Uncharacterized protein n=2 Tax=Apilactobacillus TaxID=2767877 RepID=A0A2S2JLH2_9LACO|nr:MULTISPECIES: hypothetical protein [Apilactobacillus]TPR12190.1 hypothetical protein DYZ97_07490 [Apilactobacillus timberlakei]TPR12471.1 hypothetical protein DY048_07435 [Apilactobacillus timberlakei]TPR13590.1 hypothetical protein DY052_08260 [Apilactobacillus timberlakei]TPR16327.1 hypothetical protein DYZ95_07745 [Apilactobacillus timberlakei]TPR17578.1 hypothetical protein DY138_07250 [Apilactobacillus timberlakei]